MLWGCGFSYELVMCQACNSSCGKILQDLPRALRLSEKMQNGCSRALFCKRKEALVWSSAGEEIFLSNLMTYTLDFIFLCGVRSNPWPITGWYLVCDLYFKMCSLKMQWYTPLMEALRSQVGGSLRPSMVYIVSSRPCLKRNSLRIYFNW